MTTGRRPRIGVSACFFHADPTRPIFKGRTLLYLEESLGHWIMSGGAVAYLVPTAAGPVDTAALVEELDGLVLHGGADVAPQSYGQEPLRPEWSGDWVRDQYEIALMRACMDLDRPVLGVCRGLQVINVALGGTLLQDISTQRPQSLVHRNWEVYERNEHDARVVPGTRLHALLGSERTRINSVHHQAIDRLGAGLVVEATSEPDGIVEAARLEGGPWVAGVQWHPEFQTPSQDRLFPPNLVLEDFLEAVRARMTAREDA